MGLLESVNEKNFEATIKGSPLILCDFWAEWCPPCKALTPVLEELSLEYKDKIKFIKVNVDENNTIASQFGIRGIPTMIIFKQGEKYNQLVGNHPKNKIKEALDAALI